MSSTGHPTATTTTEVRLGTEERAFFGHVVASDARRIVVAAPAPSPKRPVPRAGVRGELVWGVGTSLHALPVELAGLQPAALPLWHFRAAGPPTDAQRRTAVRVPLHLPVLVRDGAWHVGGETLDISEGGIWCVLDSGGLLDNAAGSPVSVSVFLHADNSPLHARAEVLRTKPRTDGRLSAVLRFVDLDEASQDQVRARVFLELRKRRALGRT